MIALLRRLTIIAILFGIILFIQSIQTEIFLPVNPKTLAVLGFVILASFTLGELLSFIKLPRVIGYLIIGILFGPYSAEILFIPSLTVFSKDILEDLNLINTVTLSVIALTAGMELKLAGIKNSLKSISLILLFKTVLIFLIIPGLIFLLSPYIPFLYEANWSMKLAAGLLLSVIALGTSIELTLVVADEAKAKGRFIDLILSTTIVKDILVILLLAVCLTVSAALLNPASEIKPEIFTDLGLELLFSVLVGIVFGASLIGYIKFIGKEMLLFIFAFVMIASEISALLHLETLIVFVTAGFVLQNFSDFAEILHQPLQKLALPIFITFFTVAGASIDINSIKATFIIGLILFIVRAAVLYFSVKFASKIAKEAKSTAEYGWMGFMSIGGLMLGLAILIEQKLPGFGTELKVLITSLVAFNLFLGPILLKIGLGKSSAAVTAEPETKTKEVKKIIQSKVIKVVKDYSEKFIEPDLSSEKLNKSLYQIVYKLNDILKNFDSRFIYQRSEESLELVISVSEKYTDDYIAIRSSIKDAEFSNIKIKERLRELKKELSEWYLELCSERKNVEKNILKLETLVNDLFISLVDLTDGLQREFLVDLEEDFLKFGEEDSKKDKLYKTYYRSKRFVLGLFNKDFKLTRKIDYKNIAKYFLVGQSAEEILETVNLVGGERLTTLRKIKRLFEDYLKYLDELIIISENEKYNPDLKNIILGKLQSLHETFSNEINVYRTEINNTTIEISTRLTYALSNPFNKLIDTLRIAGTYKFDSTSLKYSKIFAKSSIEKELTLEAIRYWVNFYIGFIGQFEKQAYSNLLKVKLSKVVNDTLINISEEVNNNLRTVSSEILSRISSFKKDLGNTDPKDILKSLINNTRNENLIATIQNYTENLEEIKRGKNLNNLLEHLIKSFTKEANNLPETVELLEETDFKFSNRVPVFTELKKIQLRKIAKSILEHKLPREIGEINELLINHLNITINELKNLYSIVLYHVKTAENEIKSNQEFNSALAVELVHSLADKLEYRIQQLNQQIDRLESNINSKIFEKVDNAIKTLNKYIIDNSILRSSMFVSRISHKKTLVNFIEKKVSIVLKVERKYRILAQRFYHKHFKHFVDGLISHIIISEPDEKELISENFFLNEQRLKKLPFLYRKLFDGTTIESDDFFVKNDLLERKILQALENHKTGKYSATLLIGEPGSGKNTLVNSIIYNFLKNSQIKTHNFTTTIKHQEELLKILSGLLGYSQQLKLEDLILSLNDKSNKQIIVLENIGKLFFKSINGYEAIKIFAYIVSATSKNIFWLCTIGKHPWTFINNSFEINKVFLNKIFISDLHRNDVRNIILNRHNSTGYNLYFQPDDLRELKNKIFKGKTEEEEQAYLSKVYFDRLEEYCDGNIIAGMYYWLQSIHEVYENKLLIRPLKKVQLSVLSRLDDIYLLTLSEILTHDSLTDTEHSRLFDISVEESREILVYLTSLNIVFVDQIEFLSNRYFVNKFIYKLIENELFKRNMF
ncbi:MAG: hypothetical protein CVV23_00955 [Ignavibacteriae bacterium HGW-Ignavibacteriae-2]|nr:MAG: hypothetical protein CVV23_00955 [Ignavibacteriae bacterium HGW-Ignavibacteriae-2]